MKRVLPVEVEEGLQCAVGWLLRSGAAGMRAVRDSVSWPACLAGLRKRSEAECGACGIGCLGLVMGKGGRLILRMERVLDGDGIWISIAFSGIFFTMYSTCSPRFP